MNSEGLQTSSQLSTALPMVGRRIFYPYGWHPKTVFLMAFMIIMGNAAAIHGSPIETSGLGALGSEASGLGAVGSETSGPRPSGLGAAGSETSRLKTSRPRASRPGASRPGGSDPRVSDPRVSDPGAPNLEASEALGPRASGPRASGLPESSPLQWPPLQRSPSQWSGYISMGGGYAPEFVGGNNYEPRFRPGFELTYRQRYFLSLQRGIGAVIRHKGLTAGASIAYQPGRDQDDSRALKGMGNVNPGMVGTLFGSFKIIKPLSLGLSLRQGLINTDSLLARGFVALGFFLHDRLSSQSQLSLSYASENHMQDYFGVTADQARRSGRDPFDAEASLRDASVSTGLRWKMTPMWDVLVNGRYSRLMGDAAKSPLIKKGGSRNQWGAGLSLIYNFAL